MSFCSLPPGSFTYSAPGRAGKYLTHVRDRGSKRRGRFERTKTGPEHMKAFLVYGLGVQSTSAGRTIYSSANRLIFGEGF